MIYGHDRTIHRTKHVDVETDRHGKVVAVWFRCMTLPFEQHTVDTDRAVEMETSYKNRARQGILAIDFEDGIEVLNQAEREQLATLIGKIEQGRRIKA